MQWDTVIGLEVHAQLTTNSKLFSNAPVGVNAKANSQCSHLDAALPGTLPTLNKAAIVKAIQFGLAIDGTINRRCWFERKNYFYPDLPKGYQISQYQAPIIQGGALSVDLENGQRKTVVIERAHLEEDAGKSMHGIQPGYSGIDLNRAGTPLLEIVSTPCLFSANEAIAYLKNLRILVRFLGICDGNMQEGSFRCDVNLSLKPRGSNKLGVRTELKNLNSFRFIEKAIRYEQDRHRRLLEQGKALKQETRLYDPKVDCTRSMRSKENENDYRYFPDPDLLPLQIEEALITEVKNKLPPLPSQIIATLQTDLNLQPDDLHFVLSSYDHYKFFQDIRQSINNNKLILNWLRGPYALLMQEMQSNYSTPPISAAETCVLLRALDNSTINNTTARQIFSSYLSNNKNMSELITLHLKESAGSKDALEDVVEQCILDFPAQVEQYQAGKTKLLGFFVGQIMQRCQGKADPQRISQIVQKKLQK